MTTSDKDGRGVKKSLNSSDVIYGWPHIALNKNAIYAHEFVLQLDIFTNIPLTRKQLSKIIVNNFENTSFYFLLYFFKQMFIDILGRSATINPWFSPNQILCIKRKPGKFKTKKKSTPKNKYE